MLRCRTFRAAPNNQKKKCRGDQDRTASPIAHIENLSAKAARTLSGVNGKFRNRKPVAWKIALPMAAGVTVIAVSPAPVAGTPFGVTKTLSIVGIS
jgi:hypothetical protein